jgi:TatD DNase family protein
MMQLIDTHAHIYLAEFSSDLSETVCRAKEKGVEKIIMPNINSASLEPMHQVALDFPEMCVPLIGLHPTSVKDNFRDELGLIFDRMKAYDYKAIGEIGIDLYWDRTFFKEQTEAFRFQLKVAREKSLPVVIHARDSFPEILAIVKEKEIKGLKGVFHAFTGNSTQAEEILDLGYLLGIGGILTFKNSPLAGVIERVGLDYIVLETDSPYLAPVPYRGKRNESSYIHYIAERLAKIKGTSIEEVAEITSQNAKKIFNL